MPTNVSQNAEKTGRSKIAGMPKPVFWIVLVILVVIIAGGAYYYYNMQQTNAAAAAAQGPALQTATARTGNIVLRTSGTGTLIASTESNLAFKTSGTLATLNVKVGSVVKAGDLLAQLDGSNQQVALTEAQEILNELTSPSAIAQAKLAVTTDEAKVINDQNTLASFENSTNNALAQNEYAAVVLAQYNLNQAQADWNNLKAGGYISNTREASTYEKLYNAQQAYNNAEYYYNLYSQAPAAPQVAADQATLELDNAKVVEDQNLVTALTGGTVPANASGSGLNQLNQAKLAVQNAQTELDNTKLYAPFSGTIVTVSHSVGDTVFAGSTFITIADLSQTELNFYMNSLNYANIKVGYTTNVTFDALPNTVYTGKVIQISPQLVTISGNSVVQGDLVLDAQQAAGTLPTLPLGVTAAVDIIAAQANNVVLVPVQALHQLSPTTYAVFVMVAGKPNLRIVTVGLQDGTSAEIKTGLKAGDVVTTGIQATNNTVTGTATP
ncbi:MAG: efflux RND transporter periplasmic adaptor subunit [Anaerolineales bacterium]